MSQPIGTTDAQSGRDRSAPPATRAVAAIHDGRRPAVPARGGTLSRSEFALEYEKAYRVLWVIAAGVLGRSGGAEDVVQESALLALRKIEEFEPGTHFVAWMAQMVRFVALNQVRKHSRAHLSHLGDDVQSIAAPPAAGPEIQIDQHGEMPADQSNFDDAVMRGLHALSDIARACLLLRTVEGMDYEQIGRVLGVPQGTAMSHVHRSRMRLRELLMKPSTHSDAEGQSSS